MSKAFAVLGLTDTATREEVKARWRKLCTLHHPDKGGNAVEFNLIRKAYNLAYAQAGEPQVCPRCNGTGKAIQTYGFSSVMLSCAHCGGLKHA